MRSYGGVADLLGLERGDHACWVYDNTTEWHTRVVEYLDDGLRQGQQVQYVGAAAVSELAGDLAALGDVEELLRSDRLRIEDVRGVYSDGAVDPRRQAEAFESAGWAACSAGFSGLRVAADVTPLVNSQDDVAQYVRYEHVVDRVIERSPLTGLCGVDGSVVAEPDLVRLECVHPVGRRAPFRLFSWGEALRLEGEVDAFCADLFGWTLSCVDAIEAPLVVDASAAFLDHRGMLALDAFATRLGRDLVLRSPGGTAARIADLVGLAHVRVEPAA